MEQAALRTLLSELAEDFSWLEDHCRRNPEQASHAGALRFAAALVRNCIGPSLDGQPAAPLHIVVVGGAGAGKSTVSNLLSGAVMAEANPQAGFTRHPIAYTSSNGAVALPATLGFLGPLKRLTTSSPSSLDDDVYQIRRVANAEGTFTLLENFIVWDCPDMTTWAAESYVPRLLEVAALADVIVYVASDERYNDEVPTQFLKLLLEAGKAVVVVLVKMRESDAPAFIEHFRTAVLSKLGGGAVACLPIPFLTPAQLTEPLKHAGKYRIPLLNQVAVLGEPATAARQRSVRSALYFLIGRQEQLLGIARHDLQAIQMWKHLVEQGQVEFNTRYRREFLTTEKFHRFDEALVRLLELLELPGVGKVVSTTLYVVRTPYRLLKGLFQKVILRPESPGMPERPVLEESFNGWIDMLRKEAAARASTHPLWAHVHQGFASGLADQARGRFDQGLSGFQVGMAEEVDRTARAIYEELENHPIALNTLRGTKFALEVASITGVAVMGGLSWWDLILIPLAASITHQLVELLGKQYVDTQREAARLRQETMVTQYVSAPLGEWLVQWPTSGGSTYERLQTALRRIPPALQQLQKEIDK